MNNQEIREQLVLASHRAYQRGIQTNNGGNVSARIPNTEHMLIKGSGTSFVDGTMEDFVIADYDGASVDGNGKPSREATLHGFIYRNLPNANAIVHVHSVDAIAYSRLDLDFVPKLSYHSQLKIKGEIPIFHVKTPAVQPSDLPMIGEAFSQENGISAFLLENHGIVAMGKDPIEAEHMAELIDETVRIALLDKMLMR